MIRGSEMHLSGLVVSTAEGECQRIQNIQSFGFFLAPWVMNDLNCVHCLSGFLG